ncbi:MAG: CDC48 family AAA ATPase [archaeon]
MPGNPKNDNNNQKPNENSQPGVEVKVAEIPTGRQDDVGRGIVRIESRAMRAIGIGPGEVIEVEGTRKSVAIADNAYPSDIGLGIIRMDGLTRRNVGTSVGESVTVRKAQISDAKKVTIAPAQAGMMIQLPAKTLSVVLMGRAAVKGDIIQLKGLSSRSRGWDNPFDEAMGIFEANPFFSLGEMKFIVTNTSPAGAVRINEKTEIEVLAEPAEVSEERIPDVTYEDIGGLGDEVRKVREMLEIPLKHPELFDRLGIAPPKGVLLYGPPGTGKTLLAKAVANETNAHFVIINGPEVMSKFVGEAEKKVRDVFEEASQNAPAIIFLDEIDAIAPKRDESMGAEGRVVAQLLASMDGMTKRGQVMVIAATNRPNALDPALRRTGRFDREIELGVPTRQGRKEVLLIHTRNMPLTKDVEIDRLAETTHGYVGADLEGLCKEAAMNALRRLIPKINLEDEGQIPKEVLDKLEVTMEDFNEGRKLIEPSAMREVMVEIPNIKWTDIGSLEDVKQELKESVEWPLKQREMFSRMGIKPPKGILLYGPPGTGKTLLAKAVATESEANFISVKGPEVLSKWVGESEKAIREIFRRARQVAPCIVFFDEIDSIAPIRGTETGGAKVGERVVNQLLTEMDGLEELRDVIVIAATNRPDLIDAGLMRIGRFDRHIYVPVPTKEDRLKIFQIHTKGMPIAKDVDFEELSSKLENYTGADIAGICREAAMFALREDSAAKEVKASHFESAVEKVGPTVTEDIRKFYERIQDSFKAVSFRRKAPDDPFTR